jgi:thiol-disulfide isomerase/thioredoxin
MQLPQLAALCAMPAWSLSPDGMNENAIPRRLLLAALALQVVRPPAASAEPEDARRHPWPAGKPTPALTLPAWEGPSWRLADARGDIVLLNFWASWCEPCRAEMPSLELLEQRLGSQRLKVVAVNFRETDGTIRRFLDGMSTSLTILRDTDGAAARAWQVRIFPTTFVIGRHGRALFSVTGEVDWTGPVARDWILAVL